MEIGENLKNIIKRSLNDSVWDSVDSSVDDSLSGDVWVMTRESLWVKVTDSVNIDRTLVLWR